MTHRIRPRSSLALALLLMTCAATPALAQTTAQTHAAQELARLSPVKAAVARYCATNKPAAYVCGAPRDSLARAIAAESLYAAPIGAPTSTPVVVPPVVVAPPPAPDSSVAQTGTPTPTPAPSSTFVVPAGLGGGVAAVAELPRDTAATPYPAMKQQVRLSLIANLQSALNNAQPGDEILLPPGSSFTGDFMLPKHAGAGAASCTSWIIVRTDVPDSLLGAPGVRMTPSRARALSLAKIQTPDNQQAIGSAWGVANVGCWRLVGLEILPGPTGNDVNGLVRFGDHAETDSTHQAHHLVLDRSYVHGSATPSPKNGPTLGQVRRCLLLNGKWNVVVDSWVEYCRGGTGDTQAGLSYAGTGPYRYTNNYLSGGTEVLMFGGANGGIVGAIPTDVTIHGNTVTRELADTVTLVKNLFETKAVLRLDVAGNVFRFNWADGQDGYGFNIKSVNQSSGPCTWCHSSDVTVRYNHLVQSGNGIKIAGIEEGPAQPTARVTLYQNVVDSLGYRGGNAYGIPLAVLGDGGTLSDVILANNTIAQAPWGLVTYDNGPTARQAWQSNVLWCGGYGAKGANASIGSGTLALYAPGMVWTNNTMYGCGSGYPSGSTYSSSLAAALLSGLGAQAGVVIAP